MADKEERIWIEYEKKPLKGATYSARCLVTTRKDAVEKMAKGIHHYEWYFDEKELPFWEELNEDIRQNYRNQAEAALNALLGAEK